VTADPSSMSQPVTSQPASGHHKAFSEHLKPCKEPELVLIAELTSRQEIKLRIKQNDDIPGAKVGFWQTCTQLVLQVFAVASSITIYLSCKLLMYAPSAEWLRQ